jgi:predicted DNA-binding transcriptional regulator YafY
VRAARLLNIQMLLQSRGRMSASALARTLEISVRTLHRDIDELTAAGVPVYAERGRSGGFALLPGWKASLTGLTPTEAQAVFLSGLEQPAADLGLHEQVRSAQLKLLAALPGDWRAQAERLSSRLHLDPVDWYRESEPSPQLAVVSSAVWEGRQLALHYAGWKRTGQQVVHPLGLVVKAGVWYLVALREDKPRTFRVSSILSAEVLPAAAKRPRGFDLPAYWRESVRRFERELYSSHAEVRATARGLAMLRQLATPVAHALRDVEAPQEDERVRLRIPAEPIDEAAVQLLKLAPDVEVIGPPELRRAVLRRLRAVASVYRR